MQTTAPAPFQLQDVLEWIHDARRLVVRENTYTPISPRFQGQFTASIACAIPEVVIHKALASLQYQTFDGNWATLPFTQRQFLVTSFDDHWLSHAGVATIADLDAVMASMMEASLAAHNKKGDFAPGHLRISPLAFQDDDTGRDYLLTKNVLPSATNLMSAHRARHIQAHALENSSPTPSHTRPARRM